MAETLLEGADKPLNEDTEPQSSRDGLKRRISTIVAILLSLWAATSLLWQAIQSNLIWFSGGNIIQQAHMAAATDIDQDVFLKHVAQHPTFASTFVWWHTAWLGDVYPWYWRPLTMLAFWTEDHLFGAYRFDRWQVADIVFHVLFAILLGFFAYRLTGSKFAPALTILVFSAFTPLSESLTIIGSIFGFPTLFTSSGANIVVANWKNQVEPWGGLCLLGAMLFTMSGRWWPALACACIGICFKESGWLVFPIILVTLIYAGKLKSVPLSVWIGATVAVIALLALRALGGPHLIQQAHHDSRLHVERYILVVTDQNIHFLMTNRWAIFILGGVIGLIVLNRRMTFIKKLIAVIIAFFLAGSAVGLSSGSNPEVGIALLADPTLNLTIVVYCTIECLVWLLAWREPPFRRLAIFLYALILLCALPVMSILQPDDHMLYLANAFQSTLVTAATIAAGRQILLIIEARRKGSALPQPSGQLSP